MVSGTMNKHDYRISVIRFLAMASIVLCHILQYYGNALAWWFNIGVQVFFVISGFLYGGRTVKDPMRFVIKGWVKILVPCIIFLSVALLVLHSLGYFELTTRRIVNVFFFQQLAPGLEHLWFIEYILFCYLLVPCLDAFKRSFLGVSSMAIVFPLIVGALVYVVLSRICPFHFNTAWILCFVGGYWLAFIKETKGEVSFNFISRVFIVLGVVSFLARVYGDMYILGMGGYVVRVYDFARPYMIAAIGATIFLVLYRLLNNRDSKFLRVSDKYSYDVYIVHHIFILGPLSIIKAGGGGKWPLLIACILVSSIVLHGLTSPIVSMVNRKVTT